MHPIPLSVKVYPYRPCLKAGPVQAKAKSYLLTAWDAGSGLLALTMLFLDCSWRLSGYGNLGIALPHRNSDCLPSPPPLLSSLAVSNFSSPPFSPPLWPLAVSTFFEYMQAPFVLPQALWKAASV